MRIMNLIAAGALLAAATHAQTIDQRRENQQDRVAQGISSGQLTPGETAGSSTRRRRQPPDPQDRVANGGTLTPSERQQVNREQNGMSSEIYRDKHNAATPTSAVKSAPGRPRNSSASRRASAAAA